MHSTDVQKILFATSYFGNYHKNLTSDGGNLLSYDIVELNYLRTNYRLEKITLFHYRNFRRHLTYN